MCKIFIGIGSNIEPQKNVAKAIAMLQNTFGDSLVSPVYKTSAVGFEGDDFLNLVVMTKTDLTPEKTVSAIHKIEKDMGYDRKLRQKYVPRCIDIDLLLYGGVIDKSIPLPRPGIARFAYILKPLQDIAPYLICDESGLSCSELWNGFSDNTQKIMLEDSFNAACFSCNR